MPIQYCKHCGHGTKYDFTKPKFCSACSAPFSSTGQKTTQKTKIKKRIKKAVIQNWQEEEEKPEELIIPHVDQLKVKVKPFVPIAGEKINIGVDKQGNAVNVSDMRESSARPTNYRLKKGTDAFEDFFQVAGPTKSSVDVE